MNTDKPDLVKIDPLTELEYGVALQINALEKRTTMLEANIENNLIDINIALNKRITVLEEKTDGIKIISNETNLLRAFDRITELEGKLVELSKLLVVQDKTIDLIETRLKQLETEAFNRGRLIT